MGDERTDADETTDTGSSRTRRRVALGAALAVVAAGAAFVLLDDDDDRAGDGPGADVVVDTVPTGDSPEPLTYVLRATAEVGARVRVVNEDDVPHTFTSDDGLFDTGTVGAGESAELPSLPEGRYAYHCEIHPALTGELVITG